jgi:hypothetical protein
LATFDEGFLSPLPDTAANPKGITIARARITGTN